MLKLDVKGNHVPPVQELVVVFGICVSSSLSLARAMYLYLMEISPLKTF